MTALPWDGPGPVTREHCREAIEICRKGAAVDSGKAFMRDFWRGLERVWEARLKGAE